MIFLISSEFVHPFLVTVGWGVWFVFSISVLRKSATSHIIKITPCSLRGFLYVSASCMTPLDPVYLVKLDWITAQRAVVDVLPDFNSLMTSGKFLYTDMDMPTWGCIRWGAEQRGSAPEKHLKQLLTPSHWAGAKREGLPCDLHSELHSDLWLEVAWEWDR